MISRSLATDLVTCGVLLVFGITLGSFVATHFAGPPRFYQDEFGPAVMFAAGHGFANPVVRPGSPLAEFLGTRRATLDVSTVSEETVQLDQFQQAHRYLMLSVAAVWRVSGISWASVSRVGALLCGFTIVAAYVLFRLWMPAMLSAAGAVFMALTPLHLAQVPHVRDYAKAPFIVIAMALTAAIVLRPMSRGLRIGLSAACGAIVGAGLGFKMDVAVMAPVFVASVLLFAGARPWHLLADKSVAIAAFIAALAIVGAPVIFRLSSGGSNGVHAILLGYADQFDASLGLTRPVYSVLPFYDDGYLGAAVLSYAGREGGPIPAVPSVAYDAVTQSYWLQIARHFPADLAARVYASANSILNLVFDNPALSFLREPESRANPFWNVLTNQLPHRARVSVLFEALSTFNGWGVLLGGVLVVAGAACSVRLGLFAGWMMLALAGNASLQFADRHVFHLQVIPLLALLVLADAALARRWPDRRAVRRAAITLAVSVAALALPLAALRGYQGLHLRRLFQAYVDAPRTSIPAAMAATSSGTVVVRWPGMEGRPLTQDPHRSADYYVVEYDGHPELLQGMRLRYRSASRDTDYSRITGIAADAGVNRLLFPVYGQAQGWQFDGLEMPAPLGSAVRGVYRVDQPEHLPMLLDLRLGAAWRNGALYQRLGSGDSDEAVRIIGGGSSALAWATRLEAPEASPRAEAVAMTYSPAATVTRDGIEMNGQAGSQSSYLLEFTPVVTTRPSALVVRGRLTSGGLAVGLLEHGQWSGQLIITEPGEFIAVVPAAVPGTYVPIISNATRRDHDRNRFTLSRFGVVGEN